MDNYTKTDKYIYRASATVVIILALSAGILSYSSLQKLAVISGIPEILAYLFPIVLDGLILSGTLLVLHFAVRGKRSAFGIFLTLLGVLASIAGNIAISDNNIIHQMVHGAPALVLFLALEALTILLRARSKEEHTPETPPETLNGPPRPQTQDEPVSPSETHTDLLPTTLDPHHTLPETKTPEKENLELPSYAYNWQPEPAVVESEEVEIAPEPAVVESVPQQAQPVSRSNSELNPKTIDFGALTFDTVPGETKKEKVIWLTQKNPDMKAKDLQDILGGDASYNRKVLRDVKKSLGLL